MSDFLRLRTSTLNSIRHLDLAIRHNPRAETPSDGRREQGIPLPVQKSTITITGFLVMSGRRQKAELVMLVHRKKTYGLTDSLLTPINPRVTDNRTRTSR